MLDSIWRASIDAFLRGELVRSLFERKVGRYAELQVLRCAEAGGLEAVIRIKGFQESVRVLLREIRFADDGSWMAVRQIESDREGVDALLKDMIQGKRFSVPEKIRPYLGLLKRLFPL